MELDKLKEVISNVLSVDTKEITLETTFTEDLGADSLDLFQIVMELEDAFQCKIEPEKTEQIKTVGEALELIQTTLSSNG